MLFCACILSTRVCPCLILFYFYSIDSCNFYFSQYKKKQKQKNKYIKLTISSKFYLAYVPLSSVINYFIVIKQYNSLFHCY